MTLLEKWKTSRKEDCFLTVINFIGAICLLLQNSETQNLMDNTTTSSVPANTEDTSGTLIKEQIERELLIPVARQVERKFIENRKEHLQQYVF